MPTEHTYLLRLHRSRAVSGWQWAARLEHVPGGEICRFSEPEGLLGHLRTVLRAGDLADSTQDLPAAVDDPAKPVDDGRMQAEI